VICEEGLLGSREILGSRIMRQQGFEAVGFDAVWF
jgi:hypothetical protein